ncbi:hypothetical protein [Novosphingobium sp.]|uniref:hypothetical protein n=1 Tax=Novosphingobium sp. TaxID=1874826 RepID=UPI002603C1D6|nr:hypothetical protein [Novosphingobium sp.]
MPRALCLVPLMLCGLALSACAGPVATRSGFAGADRTGFGINAADGVAIVAAPGSGELSTAARAAVAAALSKRGQAIAADSPLRLTVSVSERSADMAIVSDDGATLSPAKRQRLLQNCTDRTQRLLLVLEGKDQPPVRAWAEESHCHGTLDASLPALADQAVDALYRKEGGITLRSGQD